MTGRFEITEIAQMRHETHDLRRGETDNLHTEGVRIITHTTMHKVFDAQKNICMTRSLCMRFFVAPQEEFMVVARSIE